MREMDSLIKFCEEHLGRHWEIKLTPGLIEVSFLYEPKDSVRVRSLYAGPDAIKLRDYMSDKIQSLNYYGVII